MTLEDELNQLHIDCEKLKERNNTPKAEANHKNNPLRTYAELYCYYRKMGCSKQDSKEYSKLVMENQIENG